MKHLLRCAQVFVVATLLALTPPCAGAPEPLPALTPIVHPNPDGLAVATAPEPASR
ncbi:MAG: hypothetical protein ABIO70_18765 [Pseudomonadota bacterium]